MPGRRVLAREVSPVRAAQAPPTGPAEVLAQAPWGVLLRFAAPTTAVMSVAALSNTLSTFFVSLLGAEAIASVALVFPVGLFVTTVMAGGIGTGVASAVARALGADRQADAADVVAHALVLAGGLGLALSVSLVAGAPAVFRAMGGDGVVLDGAVAFARVVFGGLVLSYFVATCDSVLRGAGNVRVPAVWSTVSLVLQMVLTPLFMFGLGFGIVGPPAAMIVGQLVTVTPRVRQVLGRGAVTRPRAFPGRLRPGPLAEILRVGVPASAGMVLSFVAMLVLTTVLAGFGTPHLAAFGLCTRLDFILMTLIYGTGAAVLTLVGFAAGANRPEMAAGYVRRAMALVASCVTVLAVVLWEYPAVWLGLFTDDPAILAVGTSYFRTVGPTYPLIGCAMVLGFAFQGLGRAVVPLAVVAFRVVIVTAGALVLTKGLGATERAVFTLIAAGNCVAVVTLAVVFLRSVRSAR